MPRNGARGSSDSTAERTRTNRRTYLKAAGATVASVPLLAGEGAAATSRHGISFENVVDMVDDAGCDPNGNQACDGKLQSAAGSNTLLKFPSGTYRFTGRNVLNGHSNFGIVGEGDVTFTVPEDFNEQLLSVNFGTGLLVENITIDQSGATPNLQLAPNDDLEVHDVAMVGRGISSATGNNAQNALSPMVRSSGGEGRLENVVLHNEGRMGAYARVGVWIGSTNKGTLTLRNCNVEGFSNNGVYASRTSGVVKVEGGTYKNNDLSQVRIGSSGSYIDGATIEADISESNSPNPGDMLNGSGIRLESDRGGSGAEIRNCDIHIGPQVNTGAGIAIFGNYGSFAIKNTRLDFNPDQSYAIRGKSPDGSAGDVGGTLRNVSVTGDAADWVGVLIEDRPNTTVENCCIQQTGSGRTGLALHDCDGSRVANTTINAGAQALRIRNGNVSVSNIQKSGTCPAPNLGSSSYAGGSSGSDDASSGGGSSSDDSSGGDDGSSDDSSSNDDSSESSSNNPSSDSSNNTSSDNDSATSDDSSDESSSDGPSEDGSSGQDTGAETNPPDDADLVIADTNTAGGRIPYEVTTSGDIAKTDAAGATKDGNDETSGATATGGVNEWRDSYEYEGELVELEVDDRATIKIDSEENTIKVIGNEERVANYSLEVSGDLTATDTLTGEDSISDNQAEGAVKPFRDVYNYTGHLLQASIEDSVSITTEPESLGE